MTNNPETITKIMKNYLKTWWAIILRPIYFYTRLKEEDWKESALTFLMITSWILALVATVVIYIIQYFPMGSTLVEGISGLKFILILPVLLILAAVFFAITFLILGGMFTLAFSGLFYLLGWAFHFIYLVMGGRGSSNRMIQSAFYSSAVLLGGTLVFLLMILTKYAGMEFLLFRYGFNFIGFLALLYVYGLWAVAGRKAYQVPKWKAFAGALIPIIVLLILGVLFDKIALSRLAPWIT
jgi:hypothetical protein